MSSLELESLIMLLLIDRVESLHSSYVLIKILSRKFGVLDIRELAKYLIDREYVTSEVISQVRNYMVTPEGTDYLNKNEEWLKEQLSKSYPSEIDYLNKLWQRRPISS